MAALQVREGERRRLAAIVALDAAAPSQLYAARLEGHGRTQVGEPVGSVERLGIVVSRVVVRLDR
eukprot:7181656-Prymnesium_polylepis.2